MTFKTTKTIIAALALAAAAGAASAQTLLNVSYDVAREFYKDYNAAFIANYKKTTGKDVKIDQSHAGSSAQARAVADGLAADVVTMNTTTDIDFLANAGVVAKDWAKRFPQNAAPTTSTMLFLTRNGNPKGIKDWDDLIKPGVQVVIVNPKTGGNGRYAYLAAWGYVKKKGGTDAQAAEFVGKLFKNVPILARGGRDATTAFLQRNIGDVLITFESEVVSIEREFGAGKADASIPRSASWQRTPWRWSSARSPRRAPPSWPRPTWTTSIPTRPRRSRPSTRCARARRRCSRSTLPPSSRCSSSPCRNCSAASARRRRCTSTTVGSSTSCIRPAQSK